jgi:hypothetical protein
MSLIVQELLDRAFSIHEGCLFFDEDDGAKPIADPFLDIKFGMSASGGKTTVV